MIEMDRFKVTTNRIPSAIKEGSIVLFDIPKGNRFPLYSLFVYKYVIRIPCLSGGGSTSIDERRDDDLARQTRKIIS